MKKNTLIPLAAAVLMFSSAAHAASSYLTTWGGLYPNSTTEDNAGCQTCHASSTSNLNPYGEALCVSSAGSIANRIAAVTALNSDADPTGASNITEINSNTQPGWTPGNVNPTYSRATCQPTGLVEPPPSFIPGSMDPVVSNQPPVANASGPYSGTVNVPLAFNGTASNDPDGTIVTYSWAFGDGTVGSGVSPTHTYVTGGTFAVSLTVTDDVGVTATANTTATIGQGNLPPAANPNGPYSGTVGIAVAFDGTASADPDGTIISYSWNFGDGSTGTGASPTHTYASANIYNVTLQVMDNAGATDSVGTTANISAAPVNLPPVANPNGPYTGTAGVAVTFDGTASSDPDGTIVSYSWNFGDGSTGSGSTPTHSYAMDGNYTVALTVTDNQGASGVATTTATIGTAVNQPPVANANGPYNGTVGITVVFDGTGSTDRDGTIVAYSWNFGDGSTGTGPTPSHMYVANGVYTVTLVVTDNAGDTGSATTTATIGMGNQPPVANANGPYSGTTGTAVSFNGSASSDPDGSIISYSWNFGDGTSGTGVSPTHVYATAGTYNVTLLVTDNMGATDSIATTANITLATGGGGDDEDDDEEDDDEHHNDNRHNNNHEGNRQRSRD